MEAESQEQNVPLRRITDLDLPVSRAILGVGSAVQLTFDADVEAFRAEFVAFLDTHLPDEAE